MRTSICLALFASIAFAQSTTSRYETDINGRRVATSQSSTTDGTRSEYTQSVNGRPVPVEQTEEKVISESPSGKVVERIVRKFDATGRQNGTEKILIEEEKLPGGGLSVKQTTWRSDINGAMIQAERKQSETRVSGSSSTTETTIARPDISGSFSLAERRTLSSETNGTEIRANETVQRRDANGQLYDALREVKVTTKEGNSTTEQVTSYEPDSNGKLAPARQSVATSTKLNDGTEVRETNLYSNQADGHAGERGVAMQIKEQQVSERRKTDDGNVVETLSVRRPTVNDPSRLGSLQKLHETVCRGKCE